MTPERPKRHENRSPRARPTGTLEPICSEQVVTRFNPSLVVLMTILQKGSVTRFLRRRFKLIRGRIIGVAKLRNFATFVARFNSQRVPKLAVLTIRTGMSGTETKTSKKNPNEAGQQNQEDRPSDSGRIVICLTGTTSGSFFPRCQARPLTAARLA